MKQLTIRSLSLIFSLGILFSCNSSSHSDVDNSLPKFDIVEAEQPETSESNADVQPVSNIQPASAGVALNPPHGQPGHDCAVPVGQPLNSPTPTMSTPSASVSNPPAALPGARLNPPHGQPGHLCEIPVGQPLP